MRYYIFIEHGLLLDFTVGVLISASRKRAPMLRNAPKPLGITSDGMAVLQENAYPYSNPVMTDDGSMMLFISDNNNADELQSVVSYEQAQP